MRLTKRQITAGLVGVAIGALLIIGFRVATLKDSHTHYHANFALYVDGQRDEFKNFTFYEEVSSCGGNNLDNPKIRVHMHGNVNYVVHVHDRAATWGAFFANLGYTLGDNLIKTDKGVFISGQNGKKLAFLLNGKPITAAANRTIANDDVLLVSYGDGDADILEKQQKTIVDDAQKYNETADPAACSGSDKLTFWEKVKQSVWTKNSDH